MGAAHERPATEGAGILDDYDDDANDHNDAPVGDHDQSDVAHSDDDGGRSGRSSGSARPADADADTGADHDHSRAGDGPRQP
ncbi:hypothetical protein A5662_14620 [Mycobacteriaceae bacterium 1482268.1]|nr:hypothetical protein A5662_14620 [Mycobacteriaceae bacterium 1482268.1]